MSVKLRWKKNKDGSKTAYLDIYQKGNRRKKYIDIKIEKNDTDKKDKKIKAEDIRSKYHTQIIDKKFDIVSEDRMNADFLQYYQNFLSNYHRAGIKKYRYAYEKFLVYLKDQGIIKVITKSEDIRKPFSTTDQRLPFSELNFTLINGYKEYLYGPKGKLSGETPYDYFKRFKAILNRAYDERYLLENEANKVKIKKPENTLKKQILTEEELQKLANTPCGNSEVKRAFLFSCFTGMGEKEIRQMTWSEVANGRLNTQRAKNGKKISSKLPATAIQLLGDYGKSTHRIFHLPSNVAVGKNLKNWMKKADIDKHISYYCSRHTFAVMNLRNGANLKTISKLMGHASTVPTNKYLNYLDAEKNKAMENLPILSL